MRPASTLLLLLAAAATTYGMKKLYPRAKRRWAARKARRAAIKTIPAEPIEDRDS